jgi:hypothetical protein
MDLPVEYLHYVESGGMLEAFTDGEPGYVALWPLADVVQNNIDLNVPEYAPGYLGFGGDGGGELLAFDEAGCVYKLPMIGMESRYAIKIAGSWRELQERIEHHDGLPLS